jgi:hypothetical protein
MDQGHEQSQQETVVLKEAVPLLEKPVCYIPEGK